MSLELTWLPLRVRTDSRGSLIPVEFEADLPFQCARTYFIVDAPADVRRGFHAHRALTQAAFCARGSCRILMDDGREQAVAELADARRALMIPPMVWHEMFDFSADCVLVVFADQPFDEEDYIRSHDEFTSLVQSVDA